MDDETWTDATFLGSAYEQQLSSRGRWRHRQLALRPPEPGRPKLYRNGGEWRDGPAPDFKP